MAHISSTSTQPKRNEIILFESSDNAITLPVEFDGDTVWLTRNQIAKLYNRDIKTIGKHVNNALREELLHDEDRVVAKFATTAADGKTYQTEHFNLDVIISVGYRVKSQRGVEFRRWATQVLRQHSETKKTSLSKEVSVPSIKVSMGLKYIPHLKKRPLTCFIL